MGMGVGKRGKLNTEINVTPLVDVCLVLLIILMVSSTYIVAQTMKVQLPKARNTDGMADKPATVMLLKDGTLRWNDQPATEEEVKTRLREVIAADPETSVVVSADKEVQHGRVVHVLDIAKAVGVTKFAINVQGTSE